MLALAESAHGTSCSVVTAWYAKCMVTRAVLYAVSTLMQGPWSPRQKGNRPAATDAVVEVSAITGANVHLPTRWVRRDRAAR